MSQRFTPKGDSIGVVHMLDTDHAAIQAPPSAPHQAGYTVRTSICRAWLIRWFGATSTHGRSWWRSGGQGQQRLCAWSPIDGLRRLDGGMRRRASILGAVLLAPLVRWRAWRLSAVGEALIGWAVRSIPRSKRRTSGDEAFQALRQNDPLRPERIPMTWVRALRRWAKTFELTPALPHRPMILQGRRDRVVDWRHNHRIIQKIFPSASFHFFAQGRHHLQGEEPTLRSRVFAMIEEQLGGD